MRRQLLLLLIALALTAPVTAQQGALTIPRNLDQLTARSADIVRGTVISARVEKHPDFSGLNTVVVRMSVKETLKGRARGTFTFRQYIWDIRDIASGGGYRKGQDLLLMMIAPSRYGLSSPAGLEQGRFQIRRDAAGKDIAINGHGNFGLFDGIGAQLTKEGISLSGGSSSMILRQRKGPVDLAELTALIRELVNARS
jgi:hypothetical protein